MQRITTHIILAAVFFSGLMLIYRSAIHVRDLRQLEGRIVGKAIEPVYEHKGKNYYAVLFTLENQNERPGIYNGTDTVHEVLSKVDSGNYYSFVIDPDTKSYRNINLGVMEIRCKDTVVYKQSNRSSLLGGISLSVVALIAALLLWRYNKRVKVVTR